MQILAVVVVLICRWGSFHSLSSLNFISSLSASFVSCCHCTSRMIWVRQSKTRNWEVCLHTSIIKCFVAGLHFVYIDKLLLL